MGKDRAFILILEKPHHEKPHETIHEKPAHHKEILPPKEKEKSPIPNKVEHVDIEKKPDDEINVEKSAKPRKKDDTKIASESDPDKVPQEPTSAHDKKPAPVIHVG